MSQKNSAPDNRGRFKSVFVPSSFNASFFPRFILKVVILARFGVSETQKEQMHYEPFKLNFITKQ